MRRKAIARSGMCRVFWGSHGCHKQRGHRGLHWCSNSCIPCDSDHVFGDDWDRDAYVEEVLDWFESRRRVGKGWPTYRPDDWRLPHHFLAEARQRRRGEMVLVATVPLAPAPTVRPTLACTGALSYLADGGEQR